MRRLLLPVLLVAFTLPLFAATEPNPSQLQREAVDRLLVAMNIDDMLRQTIDVVYQEIEKQFVEKATTDGGDAEDIQEAKELFAAFRSRAAKLDLSGEMREAFTRIYAKYFTAEEIDAMTAFYTTPVGKKAIDLMPQLMQEGMEMGTRDLAPKIDQAMREAIEEGEKKRPWRRTMREMRLVHTAIEAWAVNNNDEYPAGDYASLKEILVPDYLDELPMNDIWGHAYAYVVADDRQNYRLVSAGADTIFEWDSRRIVLPKEGELSEIRYRDRLEDDVIFADGDFVQLPLQAKPKE